jgi:flagellar hook-length control protein FliK
MSSLRVSHQHRAIGDARLGETDRTQSAAGSGDSFALKLGAAAALVKADAGAQDDPPVADGGSSPAPLGKRGDGRAKPDAAVPSAVVNALGGGATDLTVLPTAASGNPRGVATPVAGDLVTHDTAMATIARPPHGAHRQEAKASDQATGAALGGSASVLQAPPSQTPTIQTPTIQSASPMAPIASAIRSTAAGPLSAAQDVAPAAESAAPVVQGTAPTLRNDVTPTGSGTGPPVQLLPFAGGSQAIIGTINGGAADPETRAAAPGGDPTPQPHNLLAPAATATASIPAATLAAPDPTEVSASDADPGGAEPSPGLGTGRRLHDFLATLSSVGQPVGADKPEASGVIGMVAGFHDRVAAGTSGEPDTADPSAIAPFGNPAATPPSANATVDSPSKEASSAPIAASDQLADQISGQLVRMVSSGPQEMVMRLHPPELGDLTLRVAINGRDVTAWFGSPQPQIQLAINDALGQLQTSLGNAGYSLNGAWVGADAAGTGQQRQNSPAAALPPRTDAPRTAPITGTAASQPQTSGMSIYV